MPSWLVEYPGPGEGAHKAEFPWRVFRCARSGHVAGAGAPEFAPGGYAVGATPRGGNCRPLTPVRARLPGRGGVPFTRARSPALYLRRNGGTPHGVVRRCRSA